MARQRPDASAALLDSRSSPESASAGQPSTLAPGHRLLGDLRDWLIVAWVLWWSWAYMRAPWRNVFPTCWAGREHYGDRVPAGPLIRSGR